MGLSPAASRLVAQAVDQGRPERIENPDILRAFAAIVLATQPVRRVA